MFTINFLRSISLSRTHGLCTGAHRTRESETTVQKFSSMTAENIRPGQVLLWVTFHSHFSSIFLPYPFPSPHLYSSTFLLSPSNASSFQTKMLWGQRISPSWRLSVPRASCGPPQSKAGGTSCHHDTHERQVGLVKGWTAITYIDLLLAKCLAAFLFLWNHFIACV